MDKHWQKWWQTLTSTMLLAFNSWPLGCTGHLNVGTQKNEIVCDFKVTTLFFRWWFRKNSCLLVGYMWYLICSQALEAEILSREPVVQTLVGRAQRMVRSGHFAASRIEACSAELTEKLGHLRDLASVRRLRLLDAVESQMVSAGWNQLNLW